MNNMRAFTVVETMIAVTVLALIVTGITQLSISLTRSYENTSSQLEVDQIAGLAIQRMTRDLQEAKEVEIINPTSMRVYYPEVTPDGTYNRNVRDDLNTVEYFRGDENGSPDPAGDALLRVFAGGDPRVVCSGVVELNFESSNPSSVDVTIHVSRRGAYRSVETQMIHRAIFLRNY
jgi:type II secretory pathway pseudopilin PulG